MFIYLRNLIRAEVKITAQEQVSFNGVRSPEDFNCCMMVYECMSALIIAGLSEQMRQDDEIRRVVEKHCRHLDSMTALTATGDWSHCFLRVTRGDKRVEPEKLRPALQARIQVYLGLQKASLYRQKEILFPLQTSTKDDYRVALTPTELLEMALCLNVSGKVEACGGKYSRVGVARFLAKAFGLQFPVNYNRLMAQLYEREHPTLFLDELRRSALEFFRKRNARR